MRMVSAQRVQAYVGGMSGRGVSMPPQDVAVKNFHAIGNDDAQYSWAHLSFAATR